MKNIFLCAMFVSLFLIGSIVVLQHKSFAQNANFRNVQLFITSSGRMSFFDQNDGKIYIYTDDGRQCVFIGQMEELGKPIKTTKLENQVNTYKSYTDTKGK